MDWEKRNSQQTVKRRGSYDDAPAPRNRPVLDMTEKQRRYLASLKAELGEPPLTGTLDRKRASAAIDRCNRELARREIKRRTDAGHKPRNVSPSAKSREQVAEMDAALDRIDEAA